MKKQLLIVSMVGLCFMSASAAQRSSPLSPKPYGMFGGSGLFSAQGSFLPGIQQSVQDLASYYVQKQQLEDEARRANEKALVLYKKKIRWADAHGNSLKPGKPGEAEFSNLLEKINRRLTLEKGFLKEELEQEVLFSLIIKERLQRNYLKAEIQRLMSESLAVEELENIFYKFGYRLDDDFLSFIAELQGEHPLVFAEIADLIESKKEGLENQRAKKMTTGQFDAAAKEHYKATISKVCQLKKAPLKRALKKVIDDPSFSMEKVKRELRRGYPGLSDEWIQAIDSFLDDTYRQVRAEWQSSLDWQMATTACS